MVNAVSFLWIGRCTVTVRTNATSTSTGRVTVTESNIFTNEPCRISFSSEKPSEQKEYAFQPSQTVTLFIRPDITIPSGSKITVTQNGITEIYQCSGTPAVYTAHQEIPLVLLGEWA